MKILKNKYFILGNIALLLAAIPLTLLFISRQQDIRSQATPSTSINFEPQSVSFQNNECSEQTTAVRLDPGENIVSTVELFLTFDETKFDITIEPNESVFPEILRGPTVSNGQASVTMNIGGSVTNAIQSPANIATITIIPVSATSDSPANIQIDNSKTRVFSINSESDEASENVFLSGGQAVVNIDQECIDGTAEPSPSPEASPSASPSPSPGDDIGGGTEDEEQEEPTATPTPEPDDSSSEEENQAPVCTTLTSSPSASGSAPFVLTLTAQGTDSDGTIEKATFDFGNNTVQDVTEGLGTESVTTELSHTYQNSGTYSASVVFTDNSGAVSSSCVEQISVTGDSEATPTPTTSQIEPTATFTPTPTIEAPGTLGTTAAILGGLLLIILGGVVLITL